MEKVANIYRQLPIKQKLRLIIMTSLSVALLLMCVAVLAYDRITWRQAMQDDLGVIAEMFGSSSTAALSFGDAKAAHELLSGLKSKHPIVTACLCTADGKLFATY